MSFNYSYSFETYKNWGDILPRVLTAPFLIHFSMIYYFSLVDIYCRWIKFLIPKRIRISFYKISLWFNDFFFDLLYPYTKVMFLNSLKKIRRPGTKTPVLTLHGYRVRGTVNQLSIITSVMMASSLLAFWDSFLIQKTFVCNPRLDCFIRYSISITRILHGPLENCALATENVVCFEFVYDLVGGFSSAVGVLGVSLFHFNINLTLLFWCKRKYRTYLCHRGFYCFASIVYWVQLLVYFSWIIVIFTVPVLTDILLFSDLAGVKGIAYFWGLVSLFMCIPFVYVLTSSIDERKSEPQDLPNQISLVMEDPSGDPQDHVDTPDNEQSSDTPDNEAPSDLTRHHQIDRPDDERSDSTVV